MKTTLFRRHGGPEVLEYTDFPSPEPQPGEVLVRLRAAALNRMDVMVRNGWPGLKLELPHINGAYGAGQVAALGEGVEGFDTRTWPAPAIAAADGAGPTGRVANALFQVDNTVYTGSLCIH